MPLPPCRVSPLDGLIFVASVIGFSAAGLRSSGKPLAEEALFISFATRRTSLTAAAIYPGAAPAEPITSASPYVWGALPPLSPLSPAPTVFNTVPPAPHLLGMFLVRGALPTQLRTDSNPRRPARVDGGKQRHPRRVAVSASVLAPSLPDVRRRRRGRGRGRRKPRRDAGREALREGRRCRSAGERGKGGGAARRHRAHIQHQRDDIRTIQHCTVI